MCAVAALECFERWGQAGPDTSQVGPMWSGSGKYILVWGRGEARGGLWGLSPPKFVKVSPSITEDEYIYTIRTQLKYCRLRLIGTPVNRDNRLTGTTPKNKIFSIEANTKNFGYSGQNPLNPDKINKLGSNFVLAQ